MSNNIHFEGVVRVYELSDAQLLDADFQRWWRRFSLAEKEREARLVVETRNMLMNAGRTQLLNFVGSSGSTNAFAQYYAVGTGAIYTVTPSDSSIAGELFRAQPASYSIVGNAVTVSTNFTTAQANGTYTNAGLWGNNATSTLGSGVLMTHMIYSYTKTSANAITSDYTITLT
jgi:hypothetical protein